LHLCFYFVLPATKFNISKELRLPAPLCPALRHRLRPAPAPAVPGHVVAALKISGLLNMRVTFWLFLRLQYFVRGTDRTGCSLSCPHTHTHTDINLFIYICEQHGFGTNKDTKRRRTCSTKEQRQRGDGMVTGVGMGMGMGMVHGW